MTDGHASAGPAAGRIRHHQARIRHHQARIRRHEARIRHHQAPATSTPSASSTPTRPTSSSSPSRQVTCYYCLNNLPHPTSDSDSSSEFDTSSEDTVAANTEPEQELSSDGEGTEEGDVAHPRKRTIRGPGWVGHDTFDLYCHFANRVKMDHEQVDYLRNYCDVHPHALYVCTMQKSQVIKKKGKMYFNKDFTETYLKNYISDKPKKKVLSVGSGQRE